MYINDKGQVLLNPGERCAKYASQLRTKVAVTNDNHRKKDANGRNIKLTNTQLAYRSGYLAHAKDSQRAFKSKHPNYKRKTKSNYLYRD